MTETSSCPASATKQIAVHEAGHAVVAAALGMPVERVMIGWIGSPWAKRWDRIGYVMFDSRSAHPEDALAVHMAGNAAENLQDPQTTRGALRKKNERMNHSSDFELAHQAMDAMSVPAWLRDETMARMSASS